MSMDHKREEEDEKNKNLRDAVASKQNKTTLSRNIFSDKSL